MADDPRDRRTPHKGLQIPRTISERKGSSSHDRDHLVPKHREPAFDFEPATGQVEGEELERIRARRPTDQRIGHIEKRIDRFEKKIDGMDTKVDELSVSAARIEATMTAELKATSQAVRLLEGELKAAHEDKHMVLKQTLDIDGYEAKSRVDSVIIATKGKWKAIVAMATGVFSASVLSAVIVLIAQKC